jgi:hypothetical protein
MQTVYAIFGTDVAHLDLPDPQDEALPGVK